MMALLAMIAVALATPSPTEVARQQQLVDAAAAAVAAGRADGARRGELGALMAQGAMR